MLRKRARSIQKDQQMGQRTSETCLQSDVFGQRQKTNSFSNVPGLFVGLSPMSATECDSVRSPTSPLDFKLFSNLSSSFRFPKPSQDGHQKSWDCNKVGLGSIVDSLEDEGNCPPEKKEPIPLSNSKTVLFGSQIRSKTLNSPIGANFAEAPKSLPKNYSFFPNVKSRLSNLQKGSSDVLFEIGGDPLDSDPFEKIQSFSLDAKRLGSEIYRLPNRDVDFRTRDSHLVKETIVGDSGCELLGLLPSSEDMLTTCPMPFSSADGLARPLSPKEIELSEDYTCVISHGPVPKTTHIFCDCVLECHPNEAGFGNKREGSEDTLLCSGKCLEISAPSPYQGNDFLSYCYYCNKKLEDGKDIYMYRGEKAFCSRDCRLEEILIEEEQENSTVEAPNSENGDDIFEKKLFVAI